MPPPTGEERWRGCRSRHTVAPRPIQKSRCAKPPNAYLVRVVEAPIAESAHSSIAMRTCFSNAKSNFRCRTMSRSRHHPLQFALSRLLDPSRRIGPDPRQLGGIDDQRQSISSMQGRFAMVPDVGSFVSVADLNMSGSARRRKCPVPTICRRPVSRRPDTEQCG